MNCLIGIMIGLFIGIAMGSGMTNWRWYDASQQHQPVKGNGKYEYHVIRNGDVGKLKYVERYMTRD